MERHTMKVQEIMTHDPACCTAGNTLAEAAKMMKECDCGALPVVQDLANLKPEGIITDRDIVVRGLAEGRDPFKSLVQSCMSSSLVSVSPETDVEECMRTMEKHQLRRILVVDGQGSVTGIVTQAHIARHADTEDTGQMVQGISQS